MSQGQFREWNQEEKDAYLAEELSQGLTREKLIGGMEQLLPFTKKAAFKWENNYYALIYGTVVRSARTFEGICMLLRAGLAVQAAMLTRSMFEDVIVAHWMALNQEDQDWLPERFLRHRDAIALYQRKLYQETKFAMGPMLSAPEDLDERAADLIEEFGKQATKDWWDPGKEGGGKGKGVGLRKIIVTLEKVAVERKRFHPRFAGGEEALIERIDRTVHKWLSQCVHHTAVGLPFSPVDEEEAEIPPDPLLMVGFSASWLFAQQIYLIHELNHVSYEEIDRKWSDCMAGFVGVFLGAEAADDLREDFANHYGAG
jgi:hypothetical protein